MNIFKLLRLTTLFIFIATFNFSNANEFNGLVKLENVELKTTRVNGNAEFKNSKFQSLTVNGKLNFKDLTVSGLVKINGTANGKNIECDRLIVYGNLEGYKIKVNGESILVGYFNVYDSVFKELNVHSGKISLTNTSTNNIVIKTLKNKIKQQLILKGQTIVNGDVIFESGSGEVLLDSQAKITGQIIGSKVILKSA